jgi:hypothetical protein
MHRRGAAILFIIRARSLLADRHGKQVSIQILALNDPANMS